MKTGFQSFTSNVSVSQPKISIHYLCIHYLRWTHLGFQLAFWHVCYWDMCFQKIRLGSLHFDLTLVDNFFLIVVSINIVNSVSVIIFGSQFSGKYVMISTSLISTLATLAQSISFPYWVVQDDSFFTAKIPPKKHLETSMIVQFS